MLDSIKAWIDTVDWNAIVQICIDYSYLLYFTPLPFILIGSYFLFKVCGIPNKPVNILLSILTTVLLYVFNKTQDVPIAKAVDFDAIELVAKETMLSAGVGLLAISIFTMRGIYSLIQKFTKKEKPVA